MSKPVDLDLIEAYIETVTRGPWRVLQTSGHDLTLNGHCAVLPDDLPPTAYCIDRVDAEFIATARTLVPALIREIRELRKVVAAAVEYNDSCLADNWHTRDG